MSNQTDFVIENGYLESYKGSDAHVDQHVGWAIRERQELLKRCGFTEFCTFENMQPIWHEL